LSSEKRKRRNLVLAPAATSVPRFRVSTHEDGQRKGKIKRINGGKVKLEIEGRGGEAFAREREIYIYRESEYERERV
jgi:hypothetical protein